MREKEEMKNSDFIEVVMTQVYIISQVLTSRTGAGGHVETQSIAAGDVRDAKLLDNPRGHGALAGCRRAEYHGPEDRGGATRGDRHHEKFDLQRLTCSDDRPKSAAGMLRESAWSGPYSSCLFLSPLFPATTATAADFDKAR